LFSALRLLESFVLYGAPAPNPGRCFALFNSLPAAPTAQANVRGQQNRAILHNTHALCAMRGQEKAPAPAQRINRIMQNVTGFAWPRMFYMGLSPQTPPIASLPGGYALF